MITQKNKLIALSIILGWEIGIITGFLYSNMIWSGVLTWIIIIVLPTIYFLNKKYRRNF